MITYLLSWPSKHLKALKVVIFTLSLLPSLIIVLLFFGQLQAVNPLAELMRLSGSWALNFLLITLLITPLRRWMCEACRFFRVLYGKRLSDWNWLIKCRRMLGLFCFAYATLHMLTYLWLEMDFLFDEIIYDIEERRFIIIGLCTFALLIPLAITSLDWFRKKMGKHWRRLHRLTYVVALLGLSHFFMLSKVGHNDQFFYALMLFVLLGYRILIYFELLSRNPKDDGMEVARESSK